MLHIGSYGAYLIIYDMEGKCFVKCLNYFNIDNVFLHDIDHQLEFPQIVHHKSFIHLNVHLFPRLKFPVAQVNQLYWSVFRRPQGFFSGDDPDGNPQKLTSRKLLLKPLLLLSTPTK